MTPAMNRTAIFNHMVKKGLLPDPAAEPETVWIDGTEWRVTKDGLEQVSRFDVEPEQGVAR